MGSSGETGLPPSHGLASLSTKWGEAVADLLLCFLGHQLWCSSTVGWACPLPLSELSSSWKERYQDLWLSAPESLSWHLLQDRHLGPLSPCGLLQAEGPEPGGPRSVGSLSKPQSLPVALQDQERGHIPLGNKVPAELP